jgi:outer membrane protein assembly factor BamB
VVAAATAVASVVAFLTGLLWPSGSGRPLEFTGFTHVHRVPFDQPSRTTLTAVHGDRGYAGWEVGGELTVVATGMAGGGERWRTRVGGAAQWGRLDAVSQVVLVFGQELLDDRSRPLVVLDGADGRELWRRDIRGDDRYAVVDDRLVWLDVAGAAVRGLDLAGGEEVWSHPFSSGGVPAIVRVHTDADLAGVTDAAGNPAVELDDPRLVLVGADRVVRVIEGRDGAVLSEGANLADPDDHLAAYRDRLVVAASGPGYQVLSYDLADLTAVPRLLYTAGADRWPQALTPCGDGRACVIDVEAFDPGTAVVTAIDPAGGGGLWSESVPDAEGLLPVGPWVVVATRVGFEPAVVAFDPAGDRVLERAGTAVRLNAANLLVFSGDLGQFAQAPVSADGIAVKTGEPVSLGPLPEVRGGFCSWNATHVICPDQEGASVWRFVDG